ncbi:MAG TPA: LuxR family transcriptional regulator, partial [Desulfotomaculum sp.]|nr:LuxR family transcriptional regulator [Desulfotomaculum sp.]
AGNIIGYLDISLGAEKELVSTIALLRSLVESIEDRFSRPHTDYAGQRACLSPPLPPKIEQELTPRQREILQLLVAGLADEEIAKECFISVNTVKTHCRNIYRRLRVKEPRKFRRRTRSPAPEIPL